MVTSFDPLRVYLYEDGLVGSKNRNRVDRWQVRFATHDYKDVRPGHKKDTKDRCVSNDHILRVFDAWCRINKPKQAETM